MIQEAIYMLRRWRYEFAPRKRLGLWRKEISTWSRFWSSYQKYKKMANIQDTSLLDNLYPCLGDDTAETVIEPTYFYQDAWAFEKIVNHRPRHHVDVGSHHKFVALLSKVVPVTMVDIRPLSLPLPSIQFKKGSILELPFEDGSVDSLSSLCVVEHIGLGRYGDPLDPQGTEKAINELKRVLKPGGCLYLSVPVGDESLTAFNAGRIFSMDNLKQILSPLVIKDSAFIVGSSLSKTYCHTGNFGTTGLFEIFKLDKNKE